MINQTLIKIGNEPLTQDELGYHKGFLNAAIAGILANTTDLDNAHVAGRAFGVAEAAIRELRNRSKHSTPKPKAQGYDGPAIGCAAYRNTRYCLPSHAREENASIIRVWLNSVSFTVSTGKAIAYLQSLPSDRAALFPKQIADRAQVSPETVETMVREGFLVVAKGGRA